MSASAATQGTPTFAYDVTAVDPRANEALFVSLRRASLGDDATSEAIFRWQYLEGPEGPTEALVLRHLDPVEPVGWTSVQPRRLAIDGHVELAGLLVNLVVVPAHRTARPALLLQRGALAAARPRLVNGQTSRQTSQPNSQSPWGSRSSSGIGPRSSMVV